MKQPDGRPKAGKVPAGLLGMLVVVFVGESAIERRGDRLTDLTSTSWRASGRAVAEEAVGADVLCFGDSLMKFGVSPAVVERAAGLRSYNLAVCSGGLPASYFLLRRAFEAGARPRAVLIDVEPHLLTRPPLEAPADWWAELLGPRDAVEIARAARDPDAMARFAVSAALPSKRYRWPLRRRIVGALGGREAEGQEVRWEGDRGAMLVAHEPRPAPAVDGESDVFFPKWWQGDPLNLRYLRAFLDLAAAHGTPVYWVIPPFRREIQEGREQGGQDAEFTRFVAKVAARYPGLVVIDGRGDAHEAGDFFDGTAHLDAAGAREFSLHVAARLRLTVPPVPVKSMPESGPPRAPAAVAGANGSRQQLRRTGSGREL
jgi:hypothetical protein